MSPIDNINLLVSRLANLPEETECVEFKSNNADPVQIGKDICALANSAAYFEHRFAFKVWGISDSTHEVIGTDFRPRSIRHNKQPLELWLRVKLSHNVQFEFEEAHIDDRRVVVLRIWPALYQIALFDGKAYIRTDSSTQELKRGSARETELWQRIQRTSYELQIAKQDLTQQQVFDLLDVNLYFARQDMEIPANADTIIHYLTSESIVTEQDSGAFSITNMGALLFSRSLQDFPDVRRKAARIIQYEGTSKLDSMRSKTFDRGYVLCLDDIIEYIQAITGAREVIERATRKPVQQFPHIAVRELVANALIHQDFSFTGTGPIIEVFSNRIEITNPGAPLVDTLRILNDPPRSRNEHMASLLRRLNLCEEAGSGWDKAVMACERDMLPAPKIEVGSNNTQVTLLSHIPFRNLTADERTMACYWHVCARYAMKDSGTNSSLRERFGLASGSSAQISRLIRECIGLGLIRPVDPEASNRYMRYVPAWA